MEKLSLLHRLLLQTKIELLIARKNTDVFKEELAYNNAIYSIGKVLDILCKKEASSSAGASTKKEDS